MSWFWIGLHSTCVKAETSLHSSLQLSSSKILQSGPKRFVVIGLHQILTDFSDYFTITLDNSGAYSWSAWIDPVNYYRPTTNTTKLLILVLGLLRYFCRFWQPHKTGFGGALLCRTRKWRTVTHFYKKGMRISFCFIKMSSRQNYSKGV